MVVLAMLGTTVLAPMVEAAELRQASLVADETPFVIELGGRARASLDAPRAPDSATAEEPAPRKGLWTRVKDFLAEDWRQTKEDMRAVGKWFATPVASFRAAWRRLREKVRTFRTKLFRGGKLLALSMLGKELSQEEEQVHLMLTAYIDQNGVEKLLEVLDKSNDEKLEALSAMARKVDDPVVKSQLLQRYVARQYLRMREQLKENTGEQVVQTLEKIEEEAAEMEVSDPEPKAWAPSGEVPPAPVYTPYVLDPNAKGTESKWNLRKILIGLIAGAGLVLSVFFALTTMSMAPFLAFASTVVALVAMLRDGYNYGQQIVVVPAPHQGAWPQQPPTEEPPPLVTPPPDVVLPPPAGSNPPQDPNPSPPPVNPPPPAVQAKGAGLVLNANEARAAELENLPGIGPQLARRIVQARQKSPFETPEDLMRVKGMGKKKVEALRPHLTF